MALSFRQTEILEIARNDGRVVVESLAERFNVTLQTIRRDLTDLADAGLLDRVHGGAVMRTGVSNIGYEERRRMNEASKVAIGGLTPTGSSSTVSVRWVRLSSSAGGGSPSTGPGSTSLMKATLQAFASPEDASTQARRIVRDKH